MTAEQPWSASEQIAAETMTSLTCLLAAAAVAVGVGLSAVWAVAEWVFAVVVVVTLDSVAVTAVVAG